MLGAVPVEMVDSEIGDGGRGRVELLAESELKAGNLDHHRLVAAVDMLGQGRADVAGRRGIDARRNEHGRGGLRDSRLPVGPGDGSDGHIEMPPGELDLTPHRDSPFQGLDDGQGTLGKAWAGDYEIDAGEQDRVPSPAGDGEALLQGELGLVPGVDRHRHVPVAGEGGRR